MFLCLRTNKNAAGEGETSPLGPPSVPRGGEKGPSPCLCYFPGAAAQITTNWVT